MPITKTIVVKVEDKATAKLKNVEKSSKKLNKSVGTSAKGVKGLAGSFTKGFGAVKTAVLSAIPALNAFKLSMISTGVGALVVGLGALITVFKKAQDLGSKFAKEVSTLRAVTGKTADELSVLTLQSKELGASTQFTAIEVVQLQTELAKLGFTVKDIENSTPSILDLAASLEIDLASASEFAGSVVRSFGLTTEETAKVVDVMALSTSKSALNFEALRESLKVVAPVSKATGVSLEQTAAYLGTLANNGLKGSMAGTGLSKMFIELAKKGISVEDAFEKLNNSSDKLNTAIKLVGAVGAKSFLTLAEGTESTKELKEAFDDATGSAKAMAEVRLDNLEGDTTKLSSAWDGFLLNIEDGTGILTRLARGAVQLLTKRIGQFTTSMQILSAVIKNFFEFLPLGWDATKTIFFGAFDSMIAKLKLFSGDAMLVISKIPIIGEGIDTTKVKKNLFEAEKLLESSQKRMAFGAEKFAEARKLLTLSGIAKTMKAEQKLLAEAQIKKDLEEEKAQTKPEASDEDIKKEKARLEKISKFKEALNKKDEDLYAKTEEEKLELQRQRAQQSLDLLKGSTEEKRKAQLSLNEYYDELELQLENKKYKKSEELKKDNQKKVDAIDDEFRIKNLESEEERNIAQIEKDREAKLKELEDLKATEEEKAQVKKYYAGLIETENENASKKEKQDAKDVTDAKIGIANAGLNILGAIAEEGSALSKGVAVAQATMNTYQGITAALSATSTVPDPLGQALKVANAISVGVMGLMNVKKILATKPVEKTAPNIGGVGGGGGAPAPPSFNLVEGSADNQIANSLNDQNQQPVKAFVVTSDVTSGQEMDRNIIENSSL
tara:strand:+ start:82 stop:2598 length:2517 start_codon:yes stop_codon:yes gene_type:complete